MFHEPQAPGFPLPVTPFDRLSPRQFQCVIRRAQGRTAKEIGTELRINHRTVPKYLEGARGRLDCETVSDLLRLTYRTYAPHLWGHATVLSPDQVWPPETITRKATRTFMVSTPALNVLEGNFDEIARQLGCRDLDELIKVIRCVIAHKYGQEPSAVAS